MTVPRVVVMWRTIVRKLTSLGWFSVQAVEKICWMRMLDLLDPYGQALQLQNERFALFRGFIWTHRLHERSNE